jgi:hypothetical protein
METGLWRRRRLVGGGEFSGFLNLHDFFAAEDFAVAAFGAEHPTVAGLTDVSFA